MASHSRTDSAMTHSTRRSYKEKLAKLQGDRTLAYDKAITTLEVQAEANLSYIQFQDEYFELTTRVANNASTLLKVMDELAYCEGMKFNKRSAKVDDNLTSMNMNIMLRRSADIIKYAEERIGILTEAYNDARQLLDSLTTQTVLLDIPLRRIQEKTVQTTIIGRSPTASELADASETSEYNRFGIEYITDDSESESDSEDENAETHSSSYALALRN